MADANAARPSLARTLPALVVGQVGMHGAMAGLRMAAPLQALELGYSAWAVGVLLALFAAAPVLLALRAGRMADRHGYHRPVRIAAGMTVGGLLLAVASTWLSGGLQFAALCASAGLSGTGANIGMIAIQRTAGRSARNGTERMRLFSWLGIAPSMSNVVGPVLAGFMIDAGGFRLAYASLLCLPLVSLACTRLVPVEPERPRVPASERPPAWDLLRLPGMTRLLWVNGLLSACWDVHAFAVPILGHQNGFAASTIGLILGAFTLAVTGVRLLIPLLAHRLHEARTIVAAMWGTAAVFAIYPFMPSALAMGACAVMLGLTLGSVQPMVMSTLHHLTPPDRHGEAIAFRSMVINGSSTILPLVFGAVGTAVGAAALFWAVGLAVGAGTVAARGLAGLGGAGMEGAVTLGDGTAGVQDRRNAR